MKNIRFPAICIVVVLAAVLSAAALPHEASAAADSPSDVAERFYRAYMKLKIQGLPNEAQRKVLWPMLSEELKGLFEAAQHRQEKFIQENPGEKPPWIEGDLFSSHFEGATSFEIGPSEMHGGRMEVEVRLTYRKGGETVRWTDTLILVEREGRRRVWDILFNGEWAFKAGESLRGVLGAE